MIKVMIFIFFIYVITISTNFSFVSYDTDEGIFNVSLLALDYCLEYLTFLEI